MGEAERPAVYSYGAPPALAASAALASAALAASAGPAAVALACAAEGSRAASVTPRLRFAVGVLAGGGGEGGQQRPVKTGGCSAERGCSPMGTRKRSAAARAKAMKSEGASPCASVASTEGISRMPSFWHVFWQTKRHLGVGPVWGGG